MQADDLPLQCGKPASGSANVFSSRAWRYHTWYFVSYMGPLQPFVQEHSCFPVSAGNISLDAAKDSNCLFMTLRHRQLIIHPVINQYTLILLLLSHFEWMSTWLTAEILVY